MCCYFCISVCYEMIGGVGVDSVVLESGVVFGNIVCVLINVYGGVFMWGVGSGVLVEVILVVVMMWVCVVMVDYCFVFEYCYFVVLEDVIVVYWVFFKYYCFEIIGIYG